ncbi:MAG: hypothetical protein ABJZ55_05075 [Fuerstiella sp.]
MNSTRFVYAPTDEFESARRFIERHPNATSQGAQVKRLQLGEHPKSIDKTLVVNGASTIYECRIESWEHCGSHVIVRVSDDAVEELGRAISDSPQISMQINDDEKGDCGIREIELVSDEYDSKKVTIRHSNPALRNFGNA